MTACASSWLREAYQLGLDDRVTAIHAAIAVGGTGGTSLAAAVMRETLPIGIPKMLVSTAASGDTGPIVGEADITLMYSVVDIAGTNGLLRRILANAAGAIAGMALAYEKSSGESPSSSISCERKKVALSMFGVTTPCVDKVRSYLEDNYNVECLVFHCTGHGGKAMERLVEQGEISAVLDVTTTEICDHLAGGVMSAGEHRLEASLNKGIPYIISVGATDMVNFGPRSTVPEKYRQRQLFEHNPTVTLMRTSPEECKAVGDFIVDKIKRHVKDKSKVEIVLPMGGVSIIATPGGPFHDKKADAALFGAIKQGLDGTGVPCIEDERAINDESFAQNLAERLVNLMQLKQ